MTGAVGYAVRVTVPASTANLGSGFDTLGMALGLHDVVEVEATRSGLVIEVTGQGAGQVPTDERHLVVRALCAAWETLGTSPAGLRLRCHNAIPHSRGLGSSAAAAVAGVAAAYTLHAATEGREPDLGDPRALQVAASLEGHADNAAASLYGGLVVAWSEVGEEPLDATPRYSAVRLEPYPDLAPVALVPEVESATSTTRGLLPDHVPHADAAFAASRAALAVYALTTDPDRLLAATEDRLHQDYREPAWPESMRLVRELRAYGVPAAISGAGPTVLAFPLGGVLPGDVDTAGFAVVTLPVDRTGVRVQRLA
ncbi:homoserine kinase [Longimycelium tulufanense]|uniref:Homoserine kinase n=1 Tax=Longimycelium tulufanense TaxID=907463 RepID=A0A8J3C9P1_9PSEU|nr:homoserine kinase [Longimycelium tulufanense]GGM34973.1 homoserine kinase [Longimycelium tulufanense]